VTDETVVATEDLINNF
jgi:hypothetical protein